MPLPADKSRVLIQVNRIPDATSKVWSLDFRGENAVLLMLQKIRKYHQRLGVFLISKRPFVNFGGDCWISEPSKGHWVIKHDYCIGK